MSLGPGPPPQHCTANSGYKGNEACARARAHTHTHTHTHTKGQPLNQEKNSAEVNPITLPLLHPLKRDFKFFPKLCSTFHENGDVPA